ncbi:hypothetical protein FH972_004687 [Carpinus fangiana]|uniref:Carboxypeptidase n=1 Tax=Carpinus fangiana TaxID=176857 RepID=A0A5N6QLY0_9ROSI|nr:hypothetical protein FH972_004687 [Carpinus fangiana]
MEAWNSSDSKSAAQNYEFLRNWLGVHPDFVTNPVFLGSDSYAGLTTPILAQHIINGNEAGITPHVNLKGFSIGCPHTNTDLETDARVTFAHRMALISNSMYESAKSSCHGNYAVSTNANCTEALSAITQCIKLISGSNILEPNCASLSPKEEEERALREYSQNFILPSPITTADFWCKNFEYLLMDIWGNYKSVQDALHVRQGTVEEFFRCNLNITNAKHYTYEITDVVPYHKNLTHTGLQILVFSGDHDMVIPHNGIEQWINALDLTLDTDWRPWFVTGQVAGTSVKVSMLLRLIQAWISDSIEAATQEMEWVEARRVRKDLRVWWPWDLWRVSTRALRSERCWERAERFGSLERMASDSVSSSSRALMATGRRRREERGRRKRDGGERNGEFFINI